MVKNPLYKVIFGGEVGLGGVLLNSHWGESDFEKKNPRGWEVGLVIHH